MLIILVATCRIHSICSGHGRGEEEEQRRRKLPGVEGVSRVIRRFSWWSRRVSVRMVVVATKAVVEEEKETCSGMATIGRVAF
jgi:hypothetical protein